MKRVAPILFLTALVTATPMIADAQSRDGGRGGRGGGGWRGESAQDRGDRGGGGGGRWDRGDGGRRYVADDGRRGGRDDDRGGRGDGGRGDGGRGNGGRGDGDRGDGGRGQNSLREGWREQQNEARDGVRQGRYVPLNGVLSELRRRQPGRQLDAGIENRGGRPTYRVRWAAENGRRMDFIVDAQTGAVLSVEGQ